MNITFNKKDTNALVERLSQKLVELLIPQMTEVVKKINQDEEILTRKEVCERILRCTPPTADRNFLYEKGFPYVMVGKDRRYPKKKVEEWLHKNRVKITH